MQQDMIRQQQWLKEGALWIHARTELDITEEKITTEGIFFNPQECYQNQYQNLCEILKGKGRGRLNEFIAWTKTLSVVRTIQAQ